MGMEVECHQNIFIVVYEDFTVKFFTVNVH